jgi:hypothetical protein
MATEIDFPRGGALNPRAGAPQSFGFKRSRKTSKNQSHDVKQVFFPLF